jgi:HK97 family phage major capsid protein
MNERIKVLYDEANTAHVQAKGILAEFAGAEMPAEKKTEIDKLLDAVDAKTTEAKALEAQDTRISAQDRFLNDPVTRKAFFQDKEQASGPKSDPNAEYEAAFKSYHRKGEYKLTPAEAAILAAGPQGEFKALSAGTPTEGGYLVTDTYMSELITLATAMSAMRQISRVLPPVPAGSVIAPAVDTAMSDATWTTEILTGAADAVAPFGTRKLTPHALAKRVLVSNDLIRNPSFDVEAWVRAEMAERFAVPEEAAFVNGDGISKPLGILKTVGLPTFTSTTADNIYGDDVIGWVYSLPAKYAGKARILCNRAFIRRIRTLSKPNTGTAFDNYLWQPGLAAGSPNTILDVPYSLSDQVDDGLSAADAWEASAVPAVIGDFSYYWIVDQLGMSIQRLAELYAATNQVGFIGRKATDGMCVRSEAFVGLVVHA